MPDYQDSKIYTVRHWLFYAGVLFVLGTSIGAARSLFDWSDGLTFAVGAIIGTITCAMALRKDMLGPPRHSHTRDRRA